MIDTIKSRISLLQQTYLPTGSLRERFVKRVKEAQTRLTKGMVKRGTVKDFYRDLR